MLDDGCLDEDKGIRGVNVLQLEQENNEVNQASILQCQKQAELPVKRLYKRRSFDRYDAGIITVYCLGHGSCSPASEGFTGRTTGN